MPVSDKYKIIFLHNPKTGGTTIEQLLDIIASRNHFYSTSRTINKVEPQHLTYNLLKKALPEVKFNSYFKFTFVRNPWDRLVSTYHFDTRGFKRFEDFIDFIDQLYHKYNDETIFQFPEFIRYRCSHLFRQCLFTGPGVEVYRFENFENDIKQILKHLGIDKTIPKFNASVHQHYSKYYTERTRNIVARIYSGDIQRFNYVFEEAP